MHAEMSEPSDRAKTISMTPFVWKQWVIKAEYRTCGSFPDLRSHTIGPQWSLKPQKCLLGQLVSCMQSWVTFPLLSKDTPRIEALVQDSNKEQHSRTRPASSESTGSLGIWVRPPPSKYLSKIEWGDLASRCQCLGSSFSSLGHIWSSHSKERGHGCLQLGSVVYSEHSRPRSKPFDPTALECFSETENMSSRVHPQNVLLIL